MRGAKELLKERPVEVPPRRLVWKMCWGRMVSLARLSPQCFVRHCQGLIGTEWVDGSGGVWTVKGLTVGVGYAGVRRQ